MAKTLKSFLDLIPYRNWTLGLFIVNTITVVVVFLLSHQLPPVVPLMYGNPYGAEQLASRTLLVLPPIIAIAITVANSVISYFIKDDFLKRVLVGGATICTLFSAITVIKIIFLVGNL